LKGIFLNIHKFLNFWGASCVPLFNLGAKANHNAKITVLFRQKTRRPWFGEKLEKKKLLKKFFYFFLKKVFPT